MTAFLPDLLARLRAAQTRDELLATADAIATEQGILQPLEDHDAAFERRQILSAQGMIRMPAEELRGLYEIAQRIVFEGDVTSEELETMKFARVALIECGRGHV
jgi:hypothetical protein